MKNRVDHTSLGYFFPMSLLDGCEDGSFFLDLPFSKRYVVTLSPIRIRIENRISINAKPVVGTQMAFSGLSGRLKLPVAKLFSSSSANKGLLKAETNACRVHT